MASVPRFWQRPGGREEAGKREEAGEEGRKEGRKEGRSSNALFKTSTKPQEGWELNLTAPL
eukprot:2461489-Lingulodinium_polyedra.AAC.1